MSTLFRNPLILILCIVLLSCSGKPNPSKIQKLSVSTNGLYVISTYDNNYAILWNIKKRTYKVISKHANPYSAFFIQNSQNFLWQDKHNVVHEENVTGKTITTFKSIPKLEGQLMTSDSQYYIATDTDGNIFWTNGKDWKKIKHKFIGGDLHINLAENQKYFVSSGYCGNDFDDIPLTHPKGKLNLNCIVAWKMSTGMPIKKFWKKAVESQTFATLSPNADYVVGGGVGGGTILASLNNNLKTELDWLTNPPKTYVNWDGKPLTSYSVVSLKFITQHQFLRINKYTTYALLYDLPNPKVKKYLSLGKVPYPSDGYLFRGGESIDTSPSAHILVTGQEVDDGINVYQYDPKAQTLYRVWTPIINKRSNMPPISKDVPTLPGVKFSDLTKVKQVG